MSDTPTIIFVEDNNLYNLPQKPYKNSFFDEQNRNTQCYKRLTQKGNPVLDFCICICRAYFMHIWMCLPIVDQLHRIWYWNIAHCFQQRLWNFALHSLKYNCSSASNTKFTEMSFVNTK